MTDRDRLLRVAQIALGVARPTEEQVAECEQLISEMQPGPDRQAAIDHMEMIAMARATDAEGDVAGREE